MKPFKVLYDKKCIKKIQKLETYNQNKILDWIKANLENTTNPRIHGKALTGNLKGFWRYRIGDYRLVVKIKDNELIVVAVDIGHRKEIYKL